MADSRKKYLNVDVITFLEEKMKSNTEHYQSDFEIDKEIIARCAQSERNEDKRLLWMSRRYGTQCNKEHDVFVENSSEHTTWCYYGEQGYDNKSVLACAVEILGVENGVVLGNVYELDFADLIKDIKALSVEPLEYEKTFKDGFVIKVPFEKSSSGFYYNLVEEHGAIVDSLAIPKDVAELRLTLSSQKVKRCNLNVGFFEKPVIDENALCFSGENQLKLSDVPMEVLQEMSKEAFSKYYAEATKPCGDWCPGKQFPELEKATKRLNEINDELERRGANVNANSKTSLNDQLAEAAAKVEKPSANIINSAPER